VCAITKFPFLFFLFLGWSVTFFCSWFGIFNYGKQEQSCQRHWTKWGVRRRCETNGTTCCFVWISQFQNCWKNDKKWQAVLQHHTVISKSIMLLCWYSMAFWVSIQCLMISSWYRSRDPFTKVLVLKPGYQGLGLETWWPSSWSLVSSKVLITSLLTSQTTGLVHRVTQWTDLVN